ncbi:MAG: hypothetical protein GY722_04635 [bacterium]|nr:hypothetical protein [bacterium]
MGSKFGIPNLTSDEVVPAAVYLEGLDRMSGKSIGNLMLAVNDWMLAEKILEMAGTALFLCTFCVFLKDHLVGTPVVVDEDEVAEPEAVAENTLPARADAV